MGPLIRNIINTKIVLEVVTSANVGVHALQNYLSFEDDPGSAGGTRQKKFEKIMTDLGYEMLVGGKKKKERSTQFTKD